LFWISPRETSYACQVTLWSNSLEKALSKINWCLDTHSIQHLCHITTRYFVPESKFLQKRIRRAWRKFLKISGRFFILRIIVRIAKVTSPKSTIYAVDARTSNPMKLNIGEKFWEYWIIMINQHWNRQGNWFQIRRNFFKRPNKRPSNLIQLIIKLTEMFSKTMGNCLNSKFGKIKWN
jgi:hypothetical protein